jgi:hypothetical protein
MNDPRSRPHRWSHRAGGAMQPLTARPAISNHPVTATLNRDRHWSHATGGQVVPCSWRTTHSNLSVDVAGTAVTYLTPRAYGP